ncbi:MAG: hypothetical protein WCJ96_08830 [Verrucomicrobiota bacterium]
MRPLFLALLPFAVFAADLKPRLLIADQPVFADDFSQPRELKAVAAKSPTVGAWNPNQGTRWKVADGVLRGEASTAEYQAAHDTHKGVHPRIVLTKTPAEYILQLSFRLVDGKAFIAGERKSVAPFIEIGHHIARVTWGPNGAMLLADGDSLQLDVAKEYKLENGKWYTVMVERRADEVFVQFQDGPSFYGKHPSYKSELHAVMLGGLEAGHMEIDNVTVWSIKAGRQADAEDMLKARTPTKEIRIKEAKPAEAAKKAA